MCIDVYKSQDQELNTGDTEVQRGIDDDNGGGEGGGACGEERGEGGEAAGFG
jgi:hypothetical protein